MTNNHSIKEIFNNPDYGPAPESADTALEWLNKHERKYSLFIDGKWQEPSSGKYFQSADPSNGKALAEIAKADAKDVDKAVKAAAKAFTSWKDSGGHQRSRYLYAIARQVQKHSRLFAVLESMDNGKPIRETRDIDIPLVARHFYHHAGWAQLMDSEMKGFEPIGVAGQIIPWNFPLLMLAWKVAPALSMGNTVVLKPAEYTSLTALLFAEVCQQVGLPPGVLNVITGPGSTGAELVKHPEVDKIAFTGSTEVGRIIRKATAGTGKKISLELGGKSPYIVYEDADIDSAVEGLVDAIWFNQGQVCCAGSRLLVQESIAEKFYAKVRARMEKLRIGDPLDKGIDIGAIVAPVQLKTIDELVKQGIDEGGHCWQPGTQLPEKGNYFPPTLFTNVAPSSTIVQEEVFGPVLVAMTFRTHSESVKLANNTRYGLAASIWTENINLALDIAPKIKAGTVWINCTNVFDAASGFGGYRESGFGREGGREGLYEYVQEKKKDKSPKKKAEGSKKKNPEKMIMDGGIAVGIDRTAKLYIGGKQVRPDGGYSMVIKSSGGEYIGEVSKGNRKDIRNAVEAAHANTKWAEMTGHARAQVLYYLAENLAARGEEFAQRIIQQTGVDLEAARLEVELSIDRIYTYAAFADKYDGHVHSTVHRNVTLAMPEALGTMAVVCPESLPLLGFISVVIPALAIGNNLVAVPSTQYPMSATDLYQVIETSDIPAGTLNIITGEKEELSEVLAKHDDVDGMWYFGTKEDSKNIEFLSAGNMKRTWVSSGKETNWFDKEVGEGELYLRKASQVKNIWIPYGA
jgi:aldehyde dehydrogenase (NAD+)